jgi:hypothetical protein
MKEMGMTELIEGESRELVPLTPHRLSDVGPEQMVEMASRLATTLKAIVDKQHLYATISGKRYPQVEAWMTIGRMDNVVAQEESVVRQDDGSYVATVALMRLSDGSIVGRASAMCGSPDDRPWNGRAEYNRRSMAVTRATSRAFRMQYSWIMALAGYEPTPAEEMPAHEEPLPTPTHAAAPTASEADVAGLHEASGDGLTLTELQRRASQNTIGVSDLNLKAKELFGKTINLLTNEQRQKVAEEVGIG